MARVGDLIRNSNRGGGFGAMTAIISKDSPNEKAAFELFRLSGGYVVSVSTIR